jgi:2-polyprenyl-3-methyl-5-hydroxy-6-metoxy-1,4-benzoquinol methylase
MSTKQYFGKIDIRNRNNSHTQTFLFLQEYCATHGIGTPRILEVGCNTGYFSRFLKDNGAYIYGIEPFTESAKKDGNVDDFFFGTVEDFIKTSVVKNPPAPFDAMIFGDVLEHLRDPETVLRNLLPCLKPEGIMLISVPNITHISVRRMLEDGQWLYRNYGLLDGTHIHFFSRHSLRKLLVKVGVGMERSYHVLIPGFEEYPPGVKYRIDSQGINVRDHTFQIIAQASRRGLSQEAFVHDPPRKLLLLSLNAGSSLTQMRLIQPLLYYCHDVGGELRADSSPSDDTIRWADILVIHRECQPSMLEAVRQARAYGISIVYDLDDLLYELPVGSMTQTSKEIKQTIRYMIATADVVTCTTQTLCNELKKLNPTVKIVQNTIPCNNKVDIECIHTDSTECTFIIASSSNIVIQFLIEPLKLFFQEATCRHKLVIVGYIADQLIKEGIPAKAYNICSPKEFSNILLRIKNGIGLIPLDDSLFSSCKSPIKYYHYTSCGIVSIASAVTPFNEEIQDGLSGLLVPNSTEKWLCAMRRLAVDYILRRRILARALVHCHHNVHHSQIVREWKNAFHGLPKKDAYMLNNYNINARG